MKNNKSLLALLLTLLLIFAAACNNASQSDQSSNSSNNASSSGSVSNPQTEIPPQTVDYPTKPITVIVSMAAGGNADLTARRYADVFAKNNILPQPVVVENKTGGGGVIGATEVVNAEADGYTLLACAQGGITIQTARGNATYEYTDLEPIACTIQDPIALVVKKDFPVDTVEGLIEYAKGKEGGLLLSFAGPGTFGHLAGMNFVSESKMPVSEVQYDGTATAMAAVLGGHADAYMAGFADVNRFVLSGEAKMIFVTTRNESTPAEVQSLDELGYNGNFFQYFGFFAPKGTPKEVKDIFYNALQEAQKDSVVIEASEKSGQNVVCIPGDEFQTLLDQDYQNNLKILKEIGMIE